MLGVSLREVSGLISDLMVKLSGKDGEIWLNAFKRFLRKESCWPFNVISKLRVFNPEIMIPALKEEFVVSEKYKVNVGKKRKNNEPEIAFIGEDFEFNFIRQSRGNSIVCTRTEQILSSYIPLISSGAKTYGYTVGEIDDKAVRLDLSYDYETDVAALYHLLCLQTERGIGAFNTNADGSDSILNVSGARNVIYISDHNNESNDDIYVVFTWLSKEGWNVESSHLNYKAWNENDRFFAGKFKNVKLSVL